jgi:N6-L-threonylcarbamoyladenine synthase
VVQDGRKVLSSIIATQEKVHAQYFGVVPELASRAHIENINGVIELALRRAGLTPANLKDSIDAIAYTRGPGLAGALLVGQITAQTLAYLYQLPLIDVNHLEGHLLAALLEHPQLKPPFLSLIVSGGHTELVVVKNYGVYRFLGGTRDDAAGEAFDKVAKLLQLQYPGGPVIDRRAKTGDPQKIRFPRPLLPGTWDFSFSGLKTAVVNYVKRGTGVHGSSVDDVCAGFQQAVVETLITKTFACAEKFKMKTVVLGGGVSANSALRDAFTRKGRKEKIRVFLPSLAYCTDNAAMIACAGYYKFNRMKKKAVGSSLQKIEPAMRLANW